MRISVLGLGHMGHALARRLLEQRQEVTVWNRTPGRAGELLPLGAKEATSPVEAARDADAVLLSVADDAAVRDVALKSGLAKSLGHAVLVDTSTVAPSTTRELAAACPPGRMLAVPILSAPQGVTAGRALYLLGGPRATIEKLEPLWSALGGPRRLCGDDPGLATTHKLLANYLLLTGIATLSEAVVLGQKAGLSDATLRDFFGQVPVVAPGLMNRLDDLLAGDHSGWFTTTLGAKDVRLARELGDSVGVTLPVAKLVEQRYEQAASAGHAESDLGAIVELLRR